MYRPFVNAEAKINALSICTQQRHNCTRDLSQGTMCTWLEKHCTFKPKQFSKKSFAWNSIFFYSQNSQNCWIDWIISSYNLTFRSVCSDRFSGECLSGFKYWNRQIHFAMFKALKFHCPAGPNSIELLTGKQISVLTIAEKYACVFYGLARKFRVVHTHSPWICIVTLLIC